MPAHAGTSAIILVGGLRLGASLHAGLEGMGDLVFHHLTAYSAMPSTLGEEAGHGGGKGRSSKPRDGGCIRGEQEKEEEKEGAHGQTWKKGGGK